MTLSLIQSAIIFVLSVILVVSFFCIISCYFHWKERRTQQGDPLEEAELLERRQQSPQEALEDREIQMQQFRPVRKINLARLTEDSESSQIAISRRLLSALDSKRTHRSQFTLGTPHSSSGWDWNQLKDNPAQENEAPQTSKHRFVSKWVNQTKAGIELLQKEVRTLRKTQVFREMDWKTDVIESAQQYRYFYPTNSPNYCDIMEMLRLEEGSLKAMRVIVEVDMSNCSNDREYLVRDLSQTTQFEQITQEEFRRNVQAPKAQ